jgi:molybdopterin-guanine dinucleotide biosynthesis protein B
MYQSEGGSMRVFAVSGYSGSGKTTLVEGLVKELTERGHSVITVKNTKEDVPDTQGSDTWRHREAGAITTILLGPKSTVTRHYSRRSISEALDGLECDYVLLEGLKELDLPRFWCTNEGVGDEPLPDGTKALILWEEHSANQPVSKIPVFTLEAINQLADIVENESVDLSDINL